MFSFIYSWSFVLMVLLTFSDAGLAPSCGGDIKGRKGEIKTPNHPKEYVDNLHCVWTIRVDENDTITVEFLDFNVETSTWPRKECADTFSIYDGPDISSLQLLKPQCGSINPSPIFSSGNALTVVFVTDSETRQKGVHMLWRVSDKFEVNLEPKTWQEANAACITGGGYLAVKTNRNEPLLLKQLRDVTESLWYGEYFTPWIWLKGCYKDSNRTLITSKVHVDIKENEAKSCQYRCQYSVYFGMQGCACFCLTAEDMDKLVFARSVMECNTRCSGNGNERCGGAFGITVYMNDICWSNSSEWTAKISKTISGLTCQSWASNYPHKHIFYDDNMFADGSVNAASNYCRDPDGKGAPWCYTTDVAVPWQFCDAPPCTGTCWMNPINYTGQLNVSLNGYKCRNWASDPPKGTQAYNDPSIFPDLTVEAASNYCRSPDGDPGLWCYLEIFDEWAYCGTPPCFGFSDSLEKEELCRVYWVNDNKFYFEEQSCSELEYYSCFNDEIDSVISEYQLNFNAARKVCNLNHAMSNYMALFNQPHSDHDITNHRQWLANFRGMDKTLGKDAVAKTSACKTVKLNNNRLVVETQQNCSLEYGYICQKEAILCGEHLNKANGSILSPGYPDKYESNEYCVWEIDVLENEFVEVVFLDVDIEESSACSFDYIEVLTGDANASEHLKKLCGKASNISIVLSTRKIVITFKSDKNGEGRGFHMEWFSASMPTTTFVSTVSSSHTVDTETTEQLSTVLNILEASDKNADKDIDSENASLGVGGLVGILIGALFVIGVVVVFGVFLIKRRSLKSTTQQVFELQPSVQAKNDHPNQSILPQELYSTPMQNKLRVVELQTPNETDLSNSDGSYYHHLHQTDNEAAMETTGNPYGRLQKADLYDHTGSPNRDMSGDTYDHLENNTTQSPIRHDHGNIEHDAWKGVGRSGTGGRIESNYLTPVGVITTIDKDYYNSDTKQKSGVCLGDDTYISDNGINVDDDTYCNMALDANCEKKIDENTFLEKTSVGTVIYGNLNSE